MAAVRGNRQLDILGMAVGVHVLAIFQKEYGNLPLLPRDWSSRHEQHNDGGLRWCSLDPATHAPFAAEEQDCCMSWSA
eukprot:56884-Eustigmatos_ZCMA.PRE.1